MQHIIISTKVTLCAAAAAVPDPSADYEQQENGLYFDSVELYKCGKFLMASCVCV